MREVSIREVVQALNRHYRLSRIDGDIDIDDVQSLLNKLYSLEDDITPSLAREAKTAVDGIEGYLQLRMSEVGSLLGTVQRSQHALRGYVGNKRTCRSHRVFRNV